MIANSGDYIVCVNNNWYYSELTLGKSYKVIEANHYENYADTYSIYDDTVLLRNFYYWRFKIDIRDIRMNKLLKLDEKEKEL